LLCLNRLLAFRQDRLGLHLLWDPRQSRPALYRLLAFRQNRLGLYRLLAFQQAGLQRCGPLLRLDRLLDTLGDAELPLRHATRLRRCRRLLGAGLRRGRGTFRQAELPLLTGR
jgi:hypothetical protein